jgi:iron complex outermembrane receptor protein
MPSHRHHPLFLAFLMALPAVPTAAQTNEEELRVPDVEVASKKSEPPPAWPPLQIDTAMMDNKRAARGDTASLLEGLPGLSLHEAGGVSSLPAIHGLADDRIRIMVDGMDLISACANHMNPPLSYIDPANVQSVKVFAGITPVSLGGDSIAGTIQVDSAAPEFAADGQELLHKGRVGAFYRSNNHAHGINLSATLAGERLSVRYTGSMEEADNYKATRSFKPAGLAATSMIAGGNRGWLDGDEVGSTYYKAENHALAFALRRDNHLLELRLGFQHIPYQGFPNQRMDMTDNTSQQVNLRYTGQYDWGTLQARAWHEHTRHKMNFGDDKLYWYATMGMPMLPVAGMPMETEGHNTGLKLQGDILLNQRDALRIGAEYQRYRLDDWWDPVANAAPMMGPNVFWNINDGQRDRYAVFGEWEARWDTALTTLFGVRHETVKMDTGKVQGYSSTGMMSYGNPANPASIPGAFNAADRSKTDHNLDLTALARYTPNATSSYEAGYAMKTRSPSLYERYAWSTNNSMVMNMNNWYGDGNGYVGNLGLDPEKAHTLSLSGNWHDAAKEDWELVATPYITHVDDYIDAVPCATVGKTCPARTDGFVNLSLANQTARLYGVDISGRVALVKGSGYGSLDGSAVLNYVRGRNLDTHDDLYNIMPPNLKIALQHRLGGWSNTLEMKLVAAKDHVQAVRKELRTAGYGLLNFYSSYAWQHVRLDIGIENLLDKDYDLPLGGAYLGQGATMGTSVLHGTAVPGMGRSAYAALTFDF